MFHFCKKKTNNPKLTQERISRKWDFQTPQSKKIQMTFTRTVHVIEETPKTLCYPIHFQIGKCNTIGENYLDEVNNKK